MVIGIKSAAKLIGVSIISCCMILVCALFLNYNLDLAGIVGEITLEQTAVYDAMVSNSWVVILVSGGCMLATSVVMLLFYIKHYIDSHKKELGILKAMGYSNLKIASKFWVFGVSVLIGTSAGFGGAAALMPAFYRMQNQDHLLPEVLLHFHPSLILLLVVPAGLFALLSILYACFRLKMPVLWLLKDSWQSKVKIRKHKDKEEPEQPFLKGLKKQTLASRKILVFFILFASFCFSAMTQMSWSMNDLASPMMGVMIALIGLTLAFTTLFMAITTAVRGNTKTIALMQAFGYSKKECCKAILGGYRPLGYIGFAVGTAYQYGLLKLMVSVVFKDVEGVPEYGFDLPVMLVSLGCFIVAYELVIRCYSERMKRISIKEIMLEDS
ncbi:MAG: ABC transporter permease [Oscillospiraceae bacterium]|nr:ABC transporter permease [Oscillospiraceae bacterium]